MAKRRIDPLGPRRRRNVYRYTLRQGNKILYVGQTTSPRRRAGEHRRSGKPGKMRLEGPRVNLDSALGWERGEIAAYRARNGRRSLMNRT